MIRILVAISLWIASAAPMAAPVQVPHATAELVADLATTAPGRTLTVALRIAHEPGWHTYWKYPGDSGMPTRIGWTLPTGVTAGPILWPTPRRLPVGPLTNYGYEGEVLLLSEIAVPKSWPAGQSLTLAAKADWLICKEVCIPGGATLTLDVPTGPAARPDPTWTSRIDAARSALPQPLVGWTVRAAPTDRHIVIDFVQPAGAPVPTRIDFIPETPDAVDNASPQTLEKTSSGVRLQLMAAPSFEGKITTLDGLLVADPPLGRTTASTVSMPWPGGAPKVKATPAGPTMSAAEMQAVTGNGPGIALAAAVLFAFLGGLVLNLMPCVFPVVSIKVLGFVEQAHGDRADLRRHGLAFAAGIVICFWAVAGLLLALRASGEALGWGYQLQSPIVVSALAVLFFLLGLNLSGYFEMGARVQSIAGDVRDRHGLTGAFLSGLLATAVATPCTAPFMGAALGFALTQPAIEAMLVFTSLAVGMAAPYVLLSFAPGLTRLLPRPGRWMETLKQLLAFPLYLTVVWLVWVLGEQLGTTAAAKLLAALVILTAGIWAWRRFAPTTGAVVGLAFLAAAGWIGWPGTDDHAVRQSTSDWAPYSDEALATARAKGAVFVDFTAAWCVTCQVNKRVVLSTDAVKQAIVDRGVTTLRADWTHRDEHITQALARLNRSGVPVYALYPAGGGAPELLPELLTRDVVLEALARSAPRTDGGR